MVRAEAQRRRGLSDHAQPRREATLKGICRIALEQFSIYFVLNAVIPTGGAAAGEGSLFEKLSCGKRSDLQELAFVGVRRRSERR